jgi:hypothetical protein
LEDFDEDGELKEEIDELRDSLFSEIMFGVEGLER